MRRPLVGLLDELTVHLILELRVRQAHLQSILSQRGVVINRGRLHQHVDEELTGLRGKGPLHLATSRGRHKRAFICACLQIKIHLPEFNTGRCLTLFNRT